jgi:hypothetical protein
MGQPQQSVRVSPYALPDLEHPSAGVVPGRQRVVGEKPSQSIELLPDLDLREAQPTARPRPVNDAIVDHFVERTPHRDSTDAKLIHDFALGRELVVHVKPRSPRRFQRLPELVVDGDGACLVEDRVPVGRNRFR